MKQELSLDSTFEVNFEIEKIRPLIGFKKKKFDYIRVSRELLIQF